MDVLSLENRHKNMSHVRSKNTKPEKLIRSSLFKAGFRFRICDKKYPGTPDVVLPHFYAVIFVNGCFWHAHDNCKYFVFPKSNCEFWNKKFSLNKKRDEKNIKYYQKKCWRVCVVWECAIRGKNSRLKTEKVSEKIIQWLEEPDEFFLEIKG